VVAELGDGWWAVASPLLDEVLELAEPERTRWLAALRERDPGTADLVESLLAEQRAIDAEGFLESRLPLLPAPQALEEPIAGQVVGAYTLVAPLGQGGMGVVWLASRNDGRFERHAAVKLLHAARVGRGAEERFKREGAVLARLTHPHIAGLVDAGVTAGGQPYLILEHVRGEPIDRFADASQLDLAARLALFLDVLAAVAHAHANLIVHRDIKPSNVLVREDGEVKLLDFGIAKLLDESSEGGAASHLTRDWGGAMTPAYAAPEQLVDQPVTTVTDVYALGVLLYVLLTGRHPIHEVAATPAEVLRAALEVEFPPPSAVVIAGGSDAATAVDAASRRGTTPSKLTRALRGDLDTIVAKALKKDPGERYGSVAAFADDLRHYLANEPITARADTFAYRAAKLVRRNPVAVALATLAVLTTLGGALGTAVQARRVRVQRDFALRQLWRAEAINDLDVFLLSDAAPSGKPFTVSELLADAERIAERQHGDDTVGHVELLLSIGDQYLTLDEDAKARRLLERAHASARAVHEPSTRARAACALAGALARAGEHDRAEALIAEGLAELPEEVTFVLDRVSCLRNASAVAEHRNAVQQAIERTQTAQRVLASAPLRSELVELRLYMDLAEHFRGAGRHREACVAFEQASRRLEALGRDETQTAGTLYNNWGMALFGLGHPLEAEPILRRAIELSSSDANEESVSPMLLLNYGWVLRDLARAHEGLRYAERAKAGARRAGDRVVIHQALIVQATSHNELNQPEQAEAALAELEPILAREVSENHPGHAAIRLERSYVAEARGNLEEARTQIDAALAMMDASVAAGGAGTEFIPTLLVRRADLAIERGRPGDAVADARRAVEAITAAIGPDGFSRGLGSAYLTLARALDAQGDRDAAHSAARVATTQLEKALGGDHPKTRAARKLLDRSA
jgi:serine/threonine protein kinase/tetratricopeptide (TPR) repeat protein